MYSLANIILHNNVSLNNRHNSETCNSHTPCGGKQMCSCVLVSEWMWEWTSECVYVCMCWYVYVYVCAAGVIVKCQQTETNVTTCKRSLLWGWEHSCRQKGAQVFAELKGKIYPVVFVDFAGNLHIIVFLLLYDCLLVTGWCMNETAMVSILLINQILQNQNLTCITCRDVT